MRICIVTQPLHNNYGGILQNYALQKVLKDMGHSPVTIDYVQRSFLRTLASWCKTILLRCIGRKRPFVGFTAMNKANNRFKREYINVTHRVSRYTKRIINKEGAEAVIVGSDQVWRAPYNIHTLFDMYLNFLKDLPVKRIAYAASFGTDNLNEYSSRQIDKCKSLLKRFDLITVRESTGVTICTKYFGVHATHVLDPTMLLTKTDYLKLCKTIPVKDSNFIAAYILDMSKYKNDILQKIRKKHNLRIIEFSVNHKPALSVERWLSIFRDARYVVTDSYHGIAFSIIFNKPFYAIANDNRGNTRVNSLLSSFNLTDKSDTNINWEEINSIHKKLREHSKTILYNSLNTKNNFKSSMVVHNISK